MKFPHLLALSGAVGLTLSTQAVPIAGQIRDASSNAIAAGRVTLFTSDLRFSSSNLTDWQFLTSIVNATGTNRLVEAIGTNNPFIFLRARQPQ